MLGLSTSFFAKKERTFAISRQIVTPSSTDKKAPPSPKTRQAGEEAAASDWVAHARVEGRRNASNDSNAGLPECVLTVKNCHTSVERHAAINSTGTTGFHQTNDGVGGEGRYERHEDSEREVIKEDVEIVVEKVGMGRDELSAFDSVPARFYPRILRSQMDRTNF